MAACASYMRAGNFKNYKKADTFAPVASARACERRELCCSQTNEKRDFREPRERRNSPHHKYTESNANRARFTTEAAQTPSDDTLASDTPRFSEERQTYCTETAITVYGAN